VPALGEEIWLFDSNGLKAERVSPRDIFSFGPVWAPDGRSFVCTSNPSGLFEIYRQAIDRAEASRLISTLNAQFKFLIAFTPDGASLVVAAYGPTRGWDLWATPLRGGGPPVLLLRLMSKKPQAAVSPSGRWLAYVSDESGQPEIYVTAFPNAGPRTRVSVSSGTAPAWTGGGRELLCLALAGRDSTVIVGPGRARPGVQAGKPRPILTRRGLVSFAATADGERLLLSVESGETPPLHISLSLNWTAALEGR
jgi:hypothetical protein